MVTVCVQQPLYMWYTRVSNMWSIFFIHMDVDVMHLSVFARAEETEPATVTGMG